MSDILLEIDDELKAQKIKALWQRYGQTAIALAVAAVLGTAIGTFWHNHKVAQLETATGHLLSVLNLGSDEEAAKMPDLKALDQVKATSPMPLKAVVELQLAAKQEQSGDIKAAQTTYAALAAQPGNDVIISDLAQLQAVRLALGQEGDKPDELLAKIEPLTKEGRPYRSSALEFKGLLLQQQNKIKEANAVFQQLVDDSTTPQTIRQRAQAFIDYGMKDAQ